MIAENNSLVKNIERQCGKETADKVKEISNLSSVYIVYAVDIHQVTHKELVHQFASYQSRYPERDWDDFMKYKSNWDKDKFTFDIDPMGYFVDLELAMQKAINNTLDFNEAGAYPYAVVCEMPLNVMYALSEEKEMFLLKFNEETGKYEQISWTESQGTIFLKKYGERGGFR